MNYLVCGTTNKTEYVQGFFVKYGDGGVDIEPLAHLYKTQIFDVAKKLNVIKEIQQRTPSPDTFTLAVSDEEFYFRIPFRTLDLLLYAWEQQIPMENVCKEMNLEEDQVKRAFADFTAKHNQTLHHQKQTPRLLI
jgi:NAD+ synthase